MKKYLLQNRDYLVKKSKPMIRLIACLTILCVPLYINHNTTDKTTIISSKIANESQHISIKQNITHAYNNKETSLEPTFSVTKPFYIKGIEASTNSQINYSIIIPTSFNPKDVTVICYNLLSKECIYTQKKISTFAYSDSINIKEDGNYQISVYCKNNNISKSSNLKYQSSSSYKINNDSTNSNSLILLNEDSN